MKLILKNFRTHKNKEFNLPDKGLILISGESGSGKSTILNALFYLFFGNKALKKPCSFNTTTCKVILEYKEIKITRSNKPSRFLIENKDEIGYLEDEEAQIFLNNKFNWNYEKFLISSYIPQKNNSSILSLNQTEQLNLIKNLSIENDNDKHKEKIKEIIKKYNDELKKKQTELNFCEKELLKLKKEQIKEVSFPLEHYNFQEKEDAEKEHEKINLIEIFNKEQKDLLKNIKDKKNELNNIKNEIEYIERINYNNFLNKEKIKNKKYIVEDYKEELEQIKKKKNKLQNKEEEVSLKDLEINILYLKEQNEINDLQNRYDNILNEEINIKKEKIQSLKKDLWIYNGEKKNSLLISNQIEKNKKLIEKCEEWDLYIFNFNKILKDYNSNFKPDEGIEIPKDSLIKKIEGINLEMEDKSKQMNNISEEIKNKLIKKEKLKDKIKLEKNKYICPNCKIELFVEKKNLIIKNNRLPNINKLEKDKEKNENIILQLNDNKENLNMDIDNLSNTLKYLNIIFNNIKDLKKPIIESSLDKKTLIEQNLILNELFNKNKINESLLNNISVDNLSPALISMGNEIKKKKENLGNLLMGKPDIRLPKNLEEIEKIKFEIIKNQNEINYLDEQITKINKKLNVEILEIKNTEKLGNQKESNEKSKIETLKQKLKILETEINNLEIINEENIKLCFLIPPYEKYYWLKQNILKWERKYKIIEEELNFFKTKYKYSLLFKEKYILSEILSLESTIQIINNNTKQFLENFFEKDIIDIQFTTTNKNKKKSNNEFKVNTQIFYKNYEYDNINQLSGGEFDRCTLASICAINSFINSPFLILDESLSSLDSECNTEILQFLKEFSQDKLIIVTSHEAVKGIFDFIIDL